MDTAALASRLEFARHAAHEAGQITLRDSLRPDLAVERKADASPVTVADREAEQFLRQRIAQTFADDAILGEEFADQPGNSGYRWILDPIDGTKSFISGVPFYGVLVGVEHQGRGVIGVICMPALDEMVYAAQGAGAWHVRGTQAPAPRVSAKRKLAEGLFCTSEAKTFHHVGKQAAYDQLQSAAWLTRTWGDCYGYLLVATGRAEVMVDAQMNVWDAAAVQPVIEEAGGTFTDWAGENTIHSGCGIATNGQVLDEVLAITRPMA